MQHFDCIIIGGGIVGLSTAWAVLAKTPNARLAIIEKEAVDGTVHAGPNAVLSLKREGYHSTSFNLRDFVDTMTYVGFWRLARKHARSGLQEMQRSLSKRAFVCGLQKLIPEIREEDLIPGAAGVRAQALRPD